MTGHWIVFIDETARTRQLEILAVEPKEAGRFTAIARYGFTGEKLSPVEVAGSDLGQHVTLDFTTPNRNRVVTRLGDDGRFAGEIRYFTGASAGTTRLLAIRESAAEHLLADKYVVARESKLSLVYVSASNCGPCGAWERDIGPGTKQAFLASRAARAFQFRQINHPTYMNTGEARRWPEDLHWMVKATNVASGTPRYVVLVDRKIVLNSQGRFSTRVEPLTQDLAARWERAQG
ncbi:MAG: hypothetical protein FJX47_04910 [Alphaproteobacteria bacterium]|nr:hypothetical protein [Alphaproteobacteria bacterium]